MTPVEPQTRAEILRKAHDWRMLMEGPDATDTDREAFDAWLAADSRHGDMYDFAVTFFHALGALDQGDLEKGVLRRTPAEHVFAIRSRITALFARTGFQIGAAGTALASLALAVVLVTGPAEAPPVPAEQVIVANYETGIGETRAVTLEDGTVITLGAASVLETAYSDRERQAILVTGSAFFEVATAPDRPFVVEAGDLEARVLGTAFDVNRSTENVRVAVAEGEVEVSYPYMLNEQPTRLVTRRSLTAGQQTMASRADGLAAATTVNLSTIGAWRQDKLFYNGAPLSELVADANRYSDARVVIEGDVETIANYPVRGSFNARDIDGMLSTLADIYPVEIDRSEPGLVRIRARPTSAR
ncbi:MAG: FecR domain-containing protein [Pseudomonadota bacterium]